MRGTRAIALVAIAVLALAPGISRGMTPAVPAAPQFSPPVVPALTLAYTFGAVAYVQPYYPIAVYWDDVTSGVLTYEFSVPGSSTLVSVSGLPPGSIFEDAGPGAVVFNPQNVYYTSFNATPTNGGDQFELQLLEQLPPDPDYLGILGSVTSLMASVSGENMSLQTRIAATQHFVTIGLAEQNATYGYRLTPGIASQFGSIFRVPMFVLLETGQAANASVTRLVVEDLSVSFVDSNGSSSRLTWATSDNGSGSFVLTLNLTGAESGEIKNGTSVITMTSPVTVGSLTNLAGGIIGSSVITNATQPAGWWLTVFGIETPPPFTSPETFSQVIADFAWFGDSTAGRAMYALVTLIAVATYLVEAHRAARKAAGLQAKRREASA